MSARADAAAAMFLEGYSCAQSVLAVYGPDLGLDRETALRLASPLAGGLSRTDGPCGAATGALLVVGLRFGHAVCGDEEAERRTRSLSREFLRRFEARVGCSSCTGLLGADLSEPGVAERVKDDGLAQEVCPALVRTSCDILEELFEHPDQEFPA